ncbi:hypothetical protein BHM03_00045638, partial [Ensete ventricosum]
MRIGVHKSNHVKAGGALKLRPPIARDLSWCHELSRHVCRVGPFDGDPFPWRGASLTWKDECVVGVPALVAPSVLCCRYVSQERRKLRAA